MKPLAIDMFCGLGGWTEGLLAEGYHVVGFDIERHVYGQQCYPAQLVLQDVLTIHGSQFKTADLIVASPPCQEYSYMAMPWSLAKTKQREYEDGTRDVKQLTALFDACFRIQREACEAAGRHIPLVVENVRGAQKWVGKARWNCGSMYLWGDVPALMPRVRHVKEPVDPRNRKATGGWFYDNYETSHRRWSSKSPERKEWSAKVAKIPLPLSTWIAKCFKPTSSQINHESGKRYVGVTGRALRQRWNEHLSNGRIAWRDSRSSHGGSHEAAVRSPVDYRPLALWLAHREVAGRRAWVLLVLAK